MSLIETIKAALASGAHSVEHALRSLGERIEAETAEDIRELEALVEDRQEPLLDSSAVIADPDLVAAAYARSGLSRRAWNLLGDAQRGVWISDEIAFTKALEASAVTTGPDPEEAPSSAPPAPSPSPATPDQPKVPEVLEPDAAPADAETVSGATAPAAPARTDVASGPAAELDAPPTSTAA